MGQGSAEGDRQGGILSSARRRAAVRQLIAVMGVRECLGGLVARSITGDQLIDELDRLAGDRGYPAVLRCAPLTIEWVLLLALSAGILSVHGDQPGSA
jgi:hypothetical protein